MWAGVDPAAVRAGAVARDNAARAVARANALGARLAEARRRQETLVERAATLRHASRVERSRCQRTRWEGRESVRQFVIHGVVEEQEVRAAWGDGRLVCDELLRTRALLLVDLEEEFVYDDPPRCFIATLEGPPIAVALTLIRACDHVTRIVLAPAVAA